MQIIYILVKRKGLNKNSITVIISGGFLGVIVDTKTNRQYLGRFGNT